MLMPPSLLRPTAPLALLAALVSLALGGCSALEPEVLTSLPNIQDLEDLKSRFNSGAGSPRLILLLSPT